MVASTPLTDGRGTTDGIGIRLVATDAFGEPTNLSTGTSGLIRRGPPDRNDRNGWRGAAQRSQEALAGFTLMGLRMYQPMTGRFLSVDSEPGGNATPYDYCSGDPVGCTDLSGEGFWSSLKKKVKKYAPIVAKVTEVASYIPGPIGTAAGAISGTAYLVSGNKKKAAEMYIGAAANVVPGGKIASKVIMMGAKGISKAPKLGKAAKAIVATSRRGKSSCSNSFAAGTLVLLADGSRVPIEDVAPGDKVVSTDPVTGKTTSEVVLELIVGHGTKHLLEITLDEGADPITATANHPVWVEGKGWILAEQLQVGDHMRGATGGIHLVQKIHDTGWLSGQTVYNLHVTGAGHTYAVATGDSDDPVIVHNSSCGVVYLRTDKNTGAQYIGKAKNMKRYEARRGEHQRAGAKKGTRYDFEPIEKGVDGRHLKYYEEHHIQKRGIENLENKIHAVNKKTRKAMGYRN